MSVAHSIYNGKARDFSELCNAFKLVQRKYEEFGYAKPVLSGMRYTIYNLLKTTVTFTAVYEASVVATSTLIADSPFGLPLSRDYPAEYAYLKAEHGRLAEGSMFACEADFQNKGMGVQLSLLQKMLACCIDKDIQTLCLIVNPKHLGFYQKVLGFQIMSDARSCSHVESAPGILLYRSILHDKQDRTIFGRFINEYKPKEINNELEYALSHVEIKSLLKMNPIIYLELPGKLKELFVNAVSESRLNHLTLKAEIILSKSF